jgi:hypothetical protein
MRVWSAGRDRRSRAGPDGSSEGRAAPSLARDCRKAGHVYFSTEPFPRDTKPEEVQRLNSFQEELRNEGLLGEYSGIEDLQLKVRDATEHDLNNMDSCRVSRTVAESHE